MFRLQFQTKSGKMIVMASVLLLDYLEMVAGVGRIQCDSYSEVLNDDVKASGSPSSNFGLLGNGNQGGALETFMILLNCRPRAIENL